MQWRKVIGGAVQHLAGAKQVHEVHVGGNATPGCSAATLRLSLAEAKSVLAGLQRHLVQAQAEEHCQVQATLPSVRGTAAAEGSATTAACGRFSVRSRAAPRGLSPADAGVSLRTILSQGEGDHARPLHTSV